MVVGEDNESSIELLSGEALRPSRKCSRRLRAALVHRRGRSSTNNFAKATSWSIFHAQRPLCL